MMKIFTFLILLIVNTSIYSQTPEGNLCKPTLLLSGYKSGDTIALQDVSKLNSLTIYDPCMNTVSNMIISYEFTLFKGTAVSLGGWGYPLTSRMKDVLKSTSTGSKIIIDIVKIKDLKGSIVSIGGLTLLVRSGSGSVPIKTDDLKGPKGKIPSCDPVLLIGRYKGSANITKNELNLIDHLLAFNNCNTGNTGKKYYSCNTDIFYKIGSYEISAIINEKVFSLKCTSAEFPKEIKEWFRDIKVKTKLNIANIELKLYDGSVFKIPDVFLNVTPTPKTNLIPKKKIDFTKSKGHGGG